jgi:D-glycero-beta-D-manno-heptose-7-phosphate kinase
LPEAALPTRERLLELIPASRGQPVLVLADLVADRFITGSPKRISREAPVLILRYESERLVPGGGANAIANLAALGGKPLPLGVLGDDASGQGLLALLSADGIDVSGIARRPGWPTPTKTRILGGGRSGVKQQIVRFDHEEPLELVATEVAGFAAWVSGLRTQPAVVVVSDYGYGSATPELARQLRPRLPAGCRMLVDSRYRLAEFTGLDGATPNEEEAETLLGRPLGDDIVSATAAGRELRDRLGAAFLLVTRGSRGMMLVEADGTAHVPVHGTDQVADVTGAGDTVIGTFALALAAGASPLEATLLANYAGGIVVMKMGTATLGPDELADAVARDPELLERITWVAS